MRPLFVRCSLPLAALGLACAACGGRPPPPEAPPPAAAVQALAPKATPIPSRPASKLYVVLHPGEIPGEEALESAIATAGLVVEVGASADGVDVGLPGARCTIAAAARPADVPKHFLPAEIQAHGLPEEEAKALGGTDRSTAVSCIIEDPDLHARGLPPLAEVTADALADLTQGWIHDPQTGRYWPQAAWNQSRAANPRFAADRQIRVIVDRDPDSGLSWIGTRGMVAFGRPDIEVFPVRADRVEPMRAQFVAIADGLIDEGAVGSGTVLSLGPVEALLLDRGLWAGTLPPGTIGVDRETPGETLGRLVLVDPQAPQGDLEAYRKFLRRLTVR